jgi:hypothetical protein
MHSTGKLRESDPHDAFAVAPDIVPAAWADKVLADIKRDTGTRAPSQPPRPATVAAAAPTVDTTFRATAVHDLRVANDRPAPPPSTGSRTRSKVRVFLFALCSAVIAAAWQQYGATAKQMIAAWAPPFALSSSAPTENTGLTDQADPSAAEASAADQTPPQDAKAAQASEATASIAAPSVAPPADAAQVQSMARDLAAMGQEIQLLKAGIAELKASQQAMAKPSDIKPSDIKPAEAKPVAPAPRPKVATQPPRPALLPPPGAPARRPAQAYYPPAQANSPPPQPLAPQAYQQPMPPPPPSAQFDGGDPVARPPMPLHY